ncbi:MAG: CapA family protein [Bdellovibrionota bacterium]
MGGNETMGSHDAQARPIRAGQSPAEIKIFLCGDVMTGRGIDQILPHPSSAKIYEPYLKDARDYVRLAEETSGAIPYPVSASYVWGEALEEFARMQPDLKIINLETAVTTLGKPYPKGINYRMHPENIGCLTTAGIDGCALANNHVLDWGREGLEETLDTLKRTGLKFAGAGKDRAAAEAPAIFPIPGKGRVLLFSLGFANSGIPPDWAATEQESGIAFLPDLGEASIQKVERAVRNFRAADDLVILSLHWGDNWGHEVSTAERDFAHAMIDRAGVDLIHGHSSHHPKGIEVYGRKPIFYGCGDFLNDYEGIGGHEQFRGELGLMYFVTFNASDRTLVRISLVPTHIRKLQIRRASRFDAHWLQEVLWRESRNFGTAVEIDDAHVLTAKAA